MEFERTYACSDEEAYDRLRALADYWVARHALTFVWTDRACQVSGRPKGVKVTGTIRIGNGRVHADIRAGFLAEKLGGRRYVSRKVTDYLDPSHTVGELRARIPC